jgi:hypothetical protein
MSGGTAFSYSEAAPRLTERGEFFYSKFLVTLNSNVRPVDEAHENALRYVMRQLIDENFEGKNILKNIKVLDDKDKEKKKENLIKYVNVTFSMEVGKTRRGGRLHAHIIVDMKHQTKVHIKANRLRDELETYFGQRGHVDIKYFPSSEILINYISKDILIN